MEQHRRGESISVLNDDILKRIFDYLHLDDKIRLRRTCYRWKLLLDNQLNKVAALRIGLFSQGGYHITSGVQLACDHHSPNHRQHTGTLFNERALSFPPDIETQCFHINQYDYLYRSIKYCSSSITMLSLGCLNISYRFLLVITHNLPNLEHLELIGCASSFTEKTHRNKTHQILSNVPKTSDQLPSISTFNTEQSKPFYSIILYNQHQDEQVNMEERLHRSTLVKSCDLVRESKTRRNWPSLKHLLVKECNLLNEFSLCLILAITSQTLVHLVMESNQYLTGEFLNYCGPQLKILRVKYCPSLQLKFLEDLIKIKQLLSPTNAPLISHKQHDQIPASHPQPINFRNFNQDIYCTL